MICDALIPILVLVLVTAPALRGDAFPNVRHRRTKVNRDPINRCLSSTRNARYRPEAVLADSRVSGRSATSYKMARRHDPT